MAEFAFAATFALTLMFGILDFGRALYDYHLVANAARLGSRYAIVHGTDCTAAGCPATVASIQTYVQSESPGINAAQLTVSTTWPTTQVANSNCYVSPYQEAGCLVTVTASYPFSFVAFPYASITMSSTSKMIISQ